MKIGILGCFYNCEDLLPHVLEPWLLLKNEGYDISFSVINAQFSEYAQLGYPADDTHTQELLRSYAPHFASLFISNTPLRESQARTRALQGLAHLNVDLVWLLDGDEVYTVEQIKNILSFIEKTPFDYYHVYLKNRIFDTIEWKDDFFPPRVFRTDRHQGLYTFTWDNELAYKDGTHANTVVPGIVPKALAYVNHFTWRRKDALQKIAYHKKHFGYCMYKLNEHGDLEPDESYFTLHGIAIPKLEADGSIPRSFKPRIDIIFRSHTTGNFRESAVRVTDELGGKPELSLRVLRSLIVSLLVLERVNDYEIHLCIVDDHSDEEFLEQAKIELNVCPFETNIIALPEKGNAASMEYALRYAKGRSQDFIYFVEDDYLHLPSTILEMLRAYSDFSKNLNRRNVAFFPVDYHDYYLPNAIAQTRVVLGSGRHWRVSTSSTCTFFVPKVLLEERWDLFLKNPRDDMYEGNSLNIVWREHAVLFSPIPTLAFHMHNEETMPPFSNWRQLWNAVDTPLYV